MIQVVKLIFYGPSTDEMMKAGAYLADNLLDLKTATSQEPLDSPLSRAFGRQHFFEFLEKPENEYHFRLQCRHAWNYCVQ
jgi:hypothetical protein